MRRFTLLLAVLVLVGCTAPSSGQRNIVQPPQGPVAVSGFGPTAPAVVAFPDPLIGWVGAADGIWGTQDGGDSWTQQFSSREPIVQLESADSENAWALTVSSVLIRTSNGGQSWTELEPADVSLRAIDIVSATFGVATDGTGVFVSHDGGATWEKTDASLPVADLDFVNDQEGWAAGKGKLWHTMDGGETWTIQLTLPEHGEWLGKTSVHFTTATAGWALFCLGQGAASQEPYLLYSTRDGGESWTPRLIGRWPFDPPAPRVPFGPGGYPVALAAQGEIAWIAIHSPAAGQLEVVRVSTDSEPVAGEPLPSSGSARPQVSLHFSDALEGWLVAGDAKHLGRIWRSRDGGGTWTKAGE